MKKVIIAAGVLFALTTSANAQFGKGPSGVFTSEGFGFNEGTGSFAGCTSGGQGRGGATGCNSNAGLSFSTRTSVSGRGQINAGNFRSRETQGNFQRGAFGIWGGRNDFLAIGSGSQGRETSSSFQGFQFQGHGRFSSTTNIRGSNNVSTFSRFGGSSRGGAGRK